MNNFKKENTIISYTIDKTLARNFSISICDGQIAVSVPWYASRKQINNVVQTKMSWITEKLKEYENSSKTKKFLVSQDDVIVLGTNYKMKINFKNVSSSELNLYDKLIVVDLPMKFRKANSDKIIKMVLDKFYEKITEKEAVNILEKYRVKLGLAPEDYIIRNEESFLGEFLPQEKKILISSNIAKYNRNVIEYVVLHELLHIKYKNHGKNFNKILSENIPNYKEIEARIQGLY